MTAKVKIESVKMEAPINWKETIDNIRCVRQKFPAPVDTMGCDQAHSRTDKDIDQRFQVLVSLMLSSQTKDPITWAAVQKLKVKNMGNVSGILDASEKEIEDLIHPVGFYRRKAVYLKKVAKILKDNYDGDIPDTIKDLCELPGVGPKMAHLCMLEAWNKVTGIGVDTHVHRIAARLEWVPKKGIKTPEDTRKALESWLPHEYWREINHLLVGFGQTICTPLRPKCDTCNNSPICPSANLSSSQSKVDTKNSPTTTTPTAATMIIKSEPNEPDLLEEEETKPNKKKPMKPAYKRKSPKREKKVSEPGKPKVESKGSDGLVVGGGRRRLRAPPPPVEQTIRSTRRNKR